MKITLGHSPDSDDAFMFYGLARHLVDEEGYEFEHILRDIETLNRWSLEGRLHCTAVSVHGYAYVADHYAVMTHGASMGDGYGPMIVAREELSRSALKELKIAVPGTLTSAFLALRLWLGEFDYEVVPFDRIMEAVHAGDFAAGLLIHEGQLTHGELGLRTLVDLGRWWKDDTGLPLPLGVNVIRRDLGPERMKQISRILRRSIAYGLEHRQAGIDHAQQYARGMERSVTDTFVGMYVNDWTLDMGEAGQESIRLFLKRGYEHGIISVEPKIEFVD
ncbi:MAG: MqnA/MqnD/SBP family protein [Armatimonadota bacterium]